MAHWSSLPPELLRLVAGDLDSVFDRVSFCGVCSSWRSAALFDSGHISPPPAPLVLLPADNRGSSATYLDLSDLRVRALNIPDCAGRDVFTTSHGWLVIAGGVGDDRRKITLLHPFTRQRIDLPPYPDSAHDHRRVLEAVLSSHPSPASCRRSDVFVGIVTPTRLAYCTVGVDGNWSTVTLDRRPDSCGGVGGFAYRRRAFYVLLRDGAVVDKYGVGNIAMTSQTILPWGRSPLLVPLAPTLPVAKARQVWLMESVSRDGEAEDIVAVAFFDETSRYAIFRLEELDGGTPEQWCEVDDRCCWSATAHDGTFYVADGHSLYIGGQRRRLRNYGGGAIAGYVARHEVIACRACDSVRYDNSLPPHRPHSCVTVKEVPGASGGDGCGAAAEMSMSAAAESSPALWVRECRRPMVSRWLAPTLY